MASVRVVNVDCVVPHPIGPHPPPGDTVSLSFYDTYWVGLPPIQRLFLYAGTGDNMSLPFPSILQSLKSSLSKTLHLHHPLAGKLTYLPDSGDVVVDCSPAAVGVGVAFVEAESDADITRLSSDATHDLESFLGLVPDLDYDELPSSVLAVQATRFASGGVAIGVSIHHAVADGQAVWQFLQTWAATSKRGGLMGAVPAQHDRAAIKHPRCREIARQYLKRMAPALPKTVVSSFRKEGRLQLARRTFMLDSAAIAALKRAGSHEAQQPSTFTVLSAHAWTSLAHAKVMGDDESSVLGFLADCRARLDPPLAAGYAGNCVRPCYAKATGSQLRGAGGLARACAAIGRAMREYLEDPLSGCEGWPDEYVGFASPRMVYSAGSPRFRGYETDFGWGRPSRTELVSMNHDGEVVLLGGKEEGEVQASVSISAVQMEAFVSAFAGQIVDAGTHLIAQSLVG